MNSFYDITLLITFHGEGIYAHSTLNSIERCRKYAESAGISTEYVWVLDAVSIETRRVLMSHPAASHNVQIIETDHRDCGASRNSGIQIAQGTAIAILDGDDYYSRNWIKRAWLYLCECGDNSILHPEMVISFGTHAAYCWQLDQKSECFRKDGLLVNNYWSSWSFAKRIVYLSCPYSATYPATTGFGYEDWHWNCESIASGFEHRIVPRTIGFYRRKSQGSLVKSCLIAEAIIPPTQLFARSMIREKDNDQT